MLWVERVYQPPMWLHMVVWLPLFAIVCTLLLRPIKGATVGWMSRLGFVVAEEEPDRPDGAQAAAPARLDSAAPPRGMHG